MQYIFLSLGIKIYSVQYTTLLLNLILRLLLLFSGRVKKLPGCPEAEFMNVM
jgi:hypothetical protein